MRRLLLLVGLSLTPALVSAEDGAFTGAGEVRMVGGNQVSARRRALVLARRNAVTEAAAAMLSPEQQQRYAVEIARRIADRFGRFVRNYRVLSEGQREGRFRIEVAVSLRLKRLQQEVQSIAGGAAQPSPVASGRPKIAVWLAAPAAVAAAARDQVRGALRVAGFEAVLLAGGEAGTVSVPLPRLRVAARTAGAGLLLTARVTLSRAPGVRGLGLPAARGETKTELTRVADGAALVTGAGRAHGYGDDRGAARRMAALDGVTRGLAPLVRVLRQRWPVQPRITGERLVRVSGLRSFAELQGFCRVVAGRVAGVGRCRARRLAGAEVWFALDTRLATKALATRLAGASFGGYGLTIRSDAGAVAWLEATPTPPPAEGEQR